MSKQHSVERGFWSKVRKTVGKVEFLHDALALYFCIVDAKTPVWVKGIAAGALLYFINPMDAIPDVTPVFGFTDDAGVVASAMSTVARHVREEHRQRSSRALR